jgi:glyoxylase-like metal-dependent hydrolase (beta-lactamase superfamily II)
MIGGGTTQLRVLHMPGHCSTHFCFALEKDGLLFTGDHMLAWSTTVIAPDGDIGDYFASLDRLAKRQDQIYLPGHGFPAFEPRNLLAGLAGIAGSRESRALAALRRLGPATPNDLTNAVYGNGLNPRPR